MHNYRLIRQLVACQLGTTSAEISRNSQLGYGQMRPLAVRTEVSDRTVTVGDMLLFDRLHRCAGGPRALRRRHQRDSSDDLGIRSARQLSITTATINGYRYGGCCAAVSRGRLTGPQSCEAFFTFRGAEPLCSDQSGSVGGRGSRLAAGRTPLAGAGAPAASGSRPWSRRRRCRARRWRPPSGR
jgi:hypothetical protein